MPAMGRVETSENVTRFLRPGLTEEYSVSVDGVRQDFIIQQRPAGEGELRVELDVTGATVAPLGNGVRLTLHGSGRQLAYHRLHVSDATGRELPARMEVASGIRPDVEGAHPTASRLDVLVDDANAIYPVRIDPTFSDADWVGFGGISGANGDVHSIVADATGNLYIGGDFTAVGNILASRIAKWDGSVWSALGDGLHGKVLAIAAAGEKVFAGGWFVTAGGITVNRVAQWDGNAWSALGGGVNNFVHALAVSGEMVYVGGDFTSAGGQSANRVARWDGSAWSPLGAGMNDRVNTLSLLGTNVYAGGNFTFADGLSANRIALWNGNTWTALGTGLNSNVYALAASGGDVFAGGDFTNAGGVAANYVAKWDGVNWWPLAAGVDRTVHALAVQGTNLFVGGKFGRAGGVINRPRIAKWAIGGTNNASWSGLSSVGYDGFIYALATTSSSVFAGGEFDRAGPATAGRIAEWNGNNWAALAPPIPGLNRSVTALALAGGDLYVGGAFTAAGTNQLNHVAKWTGSGWTALGSGLNGIVRSMVVSGNDLYVGGGFTTAGTNAANYIAKWTFGATDDSGWTPLGSGVCCGTVYALAVKDNYLYVGGDFTIVGNNSGSRNNIVKWAIGGTSNSSWSSLGSGVGSEVYALLIKDSDLYVGGRFVSAGGVNGRNQIAKWTIGGTNNSSWSGLGTGMNYTGLNSGVRALAITQGYLYAGGVFTNAGGTLAQYLAKWDGTMWSQVGGGVDYFVYSLAAVGPDLHVGGSFNNAGGVPAKGIAKWDGSSWSALGSGVISVSAMTASGTNLYVGGSFTLAGNKVAPYVAKANIGSACGRFRDITYSPAVGFSATFLDASVGQSYRIQSSPSLAGPWTDFTNFVYTGPVVISDPSALSGTNKFFRAVTP